MYPPLNGTTERGYVFNYPFKLRWEDFISLPNVDNQFFNVNEPHNGFNNDWARYFSGAGWTLGYRTTILAEEEGVENTFTTSDGLVIVEDYGAATDWTEEPKAYDAATMAEITGSLTDLKTIQTWEFTHIGGGGDPTIEQIIGLLGIAPVDAGGDKIIREISSVHEHEDDSPWISIDSNKLAKWEKSGSVYTISACIDPDKLAALFPNATEFCVTGRIDVIPPDNGKAFQGGDGFLYNLASGDKYSLNL